MSDRGNQILRFGDRYIGIVLVFIFGLFKVKRKRPENFKSVGVLATAAIGDTLLISPVIKDFMAKYPDVDLTIYCGKSNKGTFEMVLPNVQLVTIPVGNPFKSVKIIRENHYDVFLDFGPWPRINALLSAFANATYKVGFKSIKQHRHWVYDSVVPHLNSNHEIDNIRRVVSEFGVESKSMPTLGIAEPDKETPYIVVHMFPSGYLAHYKEWSDVNWITLINGLTDENIRVYLTGAPIDVDPCSRIVSKCKAPDFITTLAGKTNLLEAGEVLRKAVLVVSVNTGIMHMAAAYNQRVLALHGPTSPLRWGPLCDNKIDFVATTKGAGSLHLGFEYIMSDENSLDSIDPKDVLKEAVTQYKDRL